MERNLITEINNIKRLINIVESTDTDCEKQLEDKGWVVDSPKERRLKGVDCGDPGTKLSCLLDYLDQKGVTKQLTTEFGKNCYTELRTRKIYKWDSKSFASEYLTFFESGYLNYVIVFDPDINSTTLRAPKLNIPNDSNTTNDIKMWQYMIRGEWECDGTDPSNISVILKNMSYCCSFEEGNTTKEIKPKYKYSKDGIETPEWIDEYDGFDGGGVYDLNDLLPEFK